MNRCFFGVEFCQFSTFISLICYRFLETSVKKWNLSFQFSKICDFWRIINANANYQLVINYKFGNLKLLDFQAWNGFLELLTIDNFGFVKFSIPSIVVFIFAYFWKIRVFGWKPFCKQILHDRFFFISFLYKSQVLHVSDYVNSWVINSRKNWILGNLCVIPSV